MVIVGSSRPNLSNKVSMIPIEQQCVSLRYCGQIGALSVHFTWVHNAIQSNKCANKLIKTTRAILILVIKIYGLNTSVQWKHVRTWNMMPTWGTAQWIINSNYLYQPDNKLHVALFLLLYTHLQSLSKIFHTVQTAGGKKCPTCHIHILPLTVKSISL